MLPLIRSPLLLQEFSGSSPKRRRGAEEKDEGIGSPDILEEEKAEELRREMLELRQQLDKERSARIILEEQVREKDGGRGDVGETAHPAVPSQRGELEEGMERRLN
jgi:hypothetical protein